MDTINYIYGTDEDDELPGTAGVDIIFGAGGNDSIDGMEGNDTLVGQEGADTIHGGDGDDRLLGRDGNDILSGGIGRDKLLGGAGDDQLTGGADADKFVFAAGDEGFGTDVITDLNLEGTERGGENDSVSVRDYGKFRSIDEFNLFAQALNEDARDDTSATAVGDDAVLMFGTDGTIVITGGAALFTGGGTGGDLV